MDKKNAGLLKVVHGSGDGEFFAAGFTISQLKASLRDALNIRMEAIAFVNGNLVPDNYVVKAQESVEFVKRDGKKGVGERVWTGEEFCRQFQITNEDLQTWILQGLKVRRCLDGSVRITETATDEFFRGRVIESPYLNTEQAAAYCNVTKDAFYGRVERKKIKPLPGSGKENLFTKEQCDRMMKGDLQ